MYSSIEFHSTWYKGSGIILLEDISRKIKIAHHEYQTNGRYATKYNFLSHNAIINQSGEGKNRREKEHVKGAVTTRIRTLWPCLTCDLVA